VKREMADEKKFSSKAKLFVGNLSPDVTEDDLRREFGRYGEISECMLQQPKEDGGSRAWFAFIRFDYRANAERAKRELHGKSLKNREVDIRWAHSNSTLWVGDLSPAVTNELLREAFAQWGEVERAVVVTDVLSRKSKGYGFVEFASRRIALDVLRSVQDHLFLLTGSPRPVRVELARMEDDLDGLSEKDAKRSYPRNLEYQRNLELQTPPHFAQPNTLEFDFAVKWRELVMTQKAEKERLKQVHQKEQEDLYNQQADIHRLEQDKLHRIEEMQRDALLRQQQHMQQQQLQQQMAMSSMAMNPMSAAMGQLSGMPMPGGIPAGLAGMGGGLAGLAGMAGGLQGPGLPQGSLGGGMGQALGGGMMGGGMSTGAVPMNAQAQQMALLQLMQQTRGGGVMGGGMNQGGMPGAGSMGTNPMAGPMGPGLGQLADLKAMQMASAGRGMQQQFGGGRF